jgi:hypothetical protein
MANPTTEEVQAIVDWLQAGDAADYNAGLQLLDQHSKSRTLVNMLRKKDSPNNREKLRYELIKAGCAQNMEEVAHVVKVFGQVTEQVAGAVAQVGLTLGQGVDIALGPEEPAPVEVPEAVRAEVDDITLLMQKLHNERCQMSNQLADVAEAEAPQLVARILSHQNQYNALAEKRRVLAAGPAPAEGAAEQPAPEQTAAAPSGPDRAELISRRGNLRSQVSKAKKAAEAKPDDQLKAEKLAKLQVELTDLELQIKRLDA